MGQPAIAKMRCLATLHDVEVLDRSLTGFRDLLELAKAREYKGWMLEDSKNKILLCGKTKNDIIKTAIGFDPEENLPHFTPCGGCEYVLPQEGNSLLKACIWGDDTESQPGCWETGGFWGISNPFADGWALDCDLLTEENIVTEYLKAAETELEFTCVLVDLSKPSDISEYAKCFDDYQP